MGISTRPSRSSRGATRPLPIALATAFASLLVVGGTTIARPALADTGERGERGKPDTARPTKKKVKSEAKTIPKKHGAHGKPEPSLEGAVDEEKPKKTASRAKHKKIARRAEVQARPCLGEPITIDRTGLEGQTVRLVDCHRQPVDGALVAMSVLARPWGAKKPDKLPIAESHRSHAAPSSTAVGEIAPGVRLLDRGLLVRLDAIARRFGGKPISLVSGYRPQSRGSQHQSARALDMRVVGVPNEELVAFCKTLRDTGCGYYPNSSFVHVDVRNPGTGSVTWIDASGPGEGPHYVAKWPPPPEDSAHASLPAGSPTHEPSSDPWSELEDDHPAIR